MKPKVKVKPTRKLMWKANPKLTWTIAVPQDDAEIEPERDVEADGDGLDVTDEVAVGEEVVVGVFDVVELHVDELLGLGGGRLGLGVKK